MAKITRIHPELRVPPPRAELKDEKMDHRAWVYVTFTCPFCHKTETLASEMLLPVGRSSGYTLVTNHICTGEE